MLSLPRFRRWEREAAARDLLHRSRSTCNLVMWRCWSKHCRVSHDPREVKAWSPRTAGA